LAVDEDIQVLFNTVDSSKTKSDNMGMLMDCKLAYPSLNKVSHGSLHSQLILPSGKNGIHLKV